MVDGYRVSQAISVAVTLGVPDLLAAGPCPAADLALATQTHPRALYRLLRALAALGVLDERTEQASFALTELGQMLRQDLPRSLAGWAAYVTRPYHWAAWGDLLHSVRTGESAFHAQHREDVWTWRARDPAESVLFDRRRRALGGALAGVRQRRVIRGTPRHRRARRPAAPGGQPASASMLTNW
jgi:Dimerisation domain